MPPTPPLRDARAGDLRPADVGRHVRLAGWIAAKRDHGGVLFVDLRDPAGARPAGIAQLVCRPGHTAFGLLWAARVESVVSVGGTVRARPPDGVNPRLPSGEVEVDVEKAEVLSSAEVLPFPLDGEQELNEEGRLRYRYLDLRRPGMAARLAARAQLSAVVRSHLTSRGFLEVHTPVLTASSPEGARDFLVPSRLHPGEFYALPQAPQQFKQLLMVAGVERYFQIAPCFRDEASRADRSPGEFYQIDLEMAFATQEEVFVEVEALMVAAATINPAKKVDTPFPRLAYAEALDAYGTDKPDLRFGLPVTDVTEALGGSTELPLFRGAPEAGHSIRALRVPSGADQPRRWFDSFSEAARAAGAASAGAVSGGVTAGAASG
ncbi:MAG: amino acid--tRNA ligase-related protein, partial [Acidimicrobiales bacterium]